MDQDALLEAYIKRLLEVQHGMAAAQPLSDAELKRIAVESGLPESQWEAWLQRAEQHFERGKAYNSARNWEDARAELKQAVAIYPNHAEANYELAFACLRLATATENPQLEQEFEVYVAQCLAFEPLHKGALALKTEENQLDAAAAAGTRKRKRLTIIVAAGLCVLLLASHLGISGGERAAREDVRARGAQLANVYERRAALMPKLTQTVDAAAGFERSLLLELKAFEQAANAQALEQNQQAYAAEQQKAGEAISKALTQAARSPKLQSMEAFLELQTQIEGAENRISVERKRYNDAVAAYNLKIGGFPYSLYGFEPLPYFTYDTDAPQQ